jgi:prepilin-type N-terminal cleavage/methylation domain-containing protein
MARLPDPDSARCRGSRGFSLVEILVVITLIGLLMTLGYNSMQNAMENGRIVKCKNNLDQMGQALITYKNNRAKGRWPRDSGIRFLLTMYRHRQIEGRHAEIFLCPGTSDVNDLGTSGEIGSSYDDWENITSDSISYAGRDVEAFPIGGADVENQVLAADDNEGRPNHNVATNILYGDGAVLTFDLFIDGADILAEDQEYETLGIPVGPESPYEPLQVLRID